MDIHLYLACTSNPTDYPVSMQDVQDSPLDTHTYFVYTLSRCLSCPSVPCIGHNNRTVQWTSICTLLTLQIPLSIPSLCTMQDIQDSPMDNPYVPCLDPLSIPSLCTMQDVQDSRMDTHVYLAYIHPDPTVPLYRVGHIGQSNGHPGVPCLYFKSH